MQDLKQKINSLVEEFEGVRGKLSLESKSKELGVLEEKASSQDFWSDPETATKVMQKISDLKKEFEEIAGLDEEVKILQNMAKEPELLDPGLAREIGKIGAKITKLKLSTFLSEPYDEKGAIVSIHAGQGGVEAMDWASMLYRMYIRFCERRGWRVECVDLSEGEEAGIKSVTLRVSGLYAYGYLKREAGTHRLVRQSPFNADKLRQTSFALVEVLPEFEEVDLPDIEIKDEELEWQFFRSSTQGGQNVQKVSTAVRVKHLPTGVVVSAQTQRFQEQNRKIALNLLRAKLWALAQENRQKDLKELKGEYKPASWGMQIRSYVLHPYKMIKDLRTGVEISDTEAVLDGDLDVFIEAEVMLSS